MRTRLWTTFQPKAGTTFGVLHGVAWLCYLVVVYWNLVALWRLAQPDPVYYLPVIVLGWASLLMAAAFIEHWLAGADRFVPFRVALALTALASCLLGAWLTWHYAVFLFVGVVTLFQRPFELISLAVLGERFLLTALGVVTYAMYAWVSLRVVRILLQGKPGATRERALGADAAPSGEEQPFPRTAATGPVARIAKTAPAVPDAVAAPVPASSPTAGAWVRIEHVFRSEPGMPELVQALGDLPGLAQALDPADANSARDWIERLARHPGAYEVDIPRADIKDPYIRTRTIRVADAARAALIRWDEARANIVAPP